jgi:hypothetical protein
MIVIVALLFVIAATAIVAVAARPPGKRTHRAFSPTRAARPPTPTTHYP